MELVDCIDRLRVFSSVLRNLFVARPTVLGYWASVNDCRAVKSLNAVHVVRKCLLYYVYAKFNIYSPEAISLNAIPVQTRSY